jgi:hypothetical protein
MKEGGPESLGGGLFQVSKHVVHAVHVRTGVTFDDSMRSPPSRFVGDEPRALLGTGGHPLHQDTHTGVREHGPVGHVVVVMLPSWPDALDPQHSTQPPESNAQMWPAPPAMAVTLLSRDTGTGVEVFIAIPLSNVAPQQSTVPSESTAQLAVMAMTPVRLDTGTGVEDWRVVPLPSWP